MPNASFSNYLPFNISTLIFIRDTADRLLLLNRNKAPNHKLWTPIGGKLDMASGESPFECAIRETREEIGIQLNATDLHLFGIISEKAYEGKGHWLMFLFDCKRRLQALPPPHSEGAFHFFEREAIDSLSIPEIDRKGLWPLYDQHRHNFVVMRADCHLQKELDIIIEEQIALSIDR